MIIYRIIRRLEVTAMIEQIQNYYQGSDVNDHERHWHPILHLLQSEWRKIIALSVTEPWQTRAQRNLTGQLRFRKWTSDQTSQATGHRSQKYVWIRRPPYHQNREERISRSCSDDRHTQIASTDDVWEKINQEQIVIEFLVISVVVQSHVLSVKDAFAIRYRLYHLHELCIDVNTSLTNR